MTLTYEQEVLKAMLRLARKQTVATSDAIVLRVGGDERDLARALARLETAGLIELREGRAARLTLTGLAVSVALRGRRAATRARRLPQRGADRTRAA